MLSVCAAGLLPPSTAVNARLVGLAAMAGTGAAVTVKETGIVTGVTLVPPLRVTEPVWVPGAKAPVVACKVTVPLPVPVPALRVNQPVFSLARQFKVPPPVLRILSVCAAGLLPPSSAVNARLVGLARWQGTGAAVTVKETGIVKGVGFDPRVQSVTRPVWVPTVEEPVTTLMATVPVPVPVPGVVLQPSGVMTDAPVQSTAASVADTERLCGRVTAALDRGEREARGTRSDGSGTGAAVTVKETGIVKGVGFDPRVQSVTRPVWVPTVEEPVTTLMATVPVPVPVPGVVLQPSGVMTDAPVQGTAASVADAERLCGGVTAALDRGEREARGTRSDGQGPVPP